MGEATASERKCIDTKKEHLPLARNSVDSAQLTDVAMLLWMGSPDPEFVASPKFEGSIPGRNFKVGENGVGYYIESDDVHVARRPSERQLAHMMAMQDCYDRMDPYFLRTRSLPVSPAITSPTTPKVFQS